MGNEKSIHRRSIRVRPADLLDRIGTEVETRLDSRLVVTARDISSV